MGLSRRSPRCIIIAGPNGAGKTTFARTYLADIAEVKRFVNADLIAAGLSPLQPELKSREAGRLFLRELDSLAHRMSDFSFETTLSGRTMINRLRSMKAKGYHIEIVYLRLHSPEIAVRRVAARVLQGGHDVPRQDILRRFGKSWANFKTLYRPLADSWAVYDNSQVTPRILERSQ